MASPVEGARPTGVGRRRLRSLVAGLLVLVVLAAIGLLGARLWLQAAARASLPQLDGALAVPGLAAPVTVLRDARGVPHLRAERMEDLVFAQGFVTTGDRLFQMDLLRRHAAGELAQVLGRKLLAHDRAQRTLQIRAAADRAVAALPADQLALLTRYAAGVNAAIDRLGDHLPIEFRVLGYRPSPWTPRDSLLVSMAMFEDLTNQYTVKLAREALTARLPPELAADLYPVGSWRDHPPASPAPDLTLDGPPIEQVPLDESQGALRLPAASEPAELADLSSAPACTSCRPGSNNWVVSGAHTASGRPLLANDMHLRLAAPGVWYEADLALNGAPFHVAGVTLPGLPLVVVGHNDHIAWGFTNLGADVQDVYIEQTRGNGAEQQFLAADKTWQPVAHLREVIAVHGAAEEVLDVRATRHGQTLTPILTPLLQGERRTLALRWTLYDPAATTLPVRELAQASDWPGFLAAFSKFGGPAQNVVYADTAGHIGYHAVGFVPTRGPVTQPGPPLPADLAADGSMPDASAKGIRRDAGPLAATVLEPRTAAAKQMLSGPLNPMPVVPSPATEWTGYVPFEAMPWVFDPPGGVLATANARTTSDDAQYPIALDWGAPYRNERIWHALAHRTGLTATDMLALQTDVFSDFDHVLAQRLAYAIDHAASLRAGPYDQNQTAALRSVADLLRGWDGRMSSDSAAAAIVGSVHPLLWPMLLAPHLPGTPESQVAGMYSWGERDYALEELLAHQPPRWLPPGFATWDDLLTAAVERGLTDAKAPRNLNAWHYGTGHVVTMEHPLFSQSAPLRALFGLETGSGVQPLSGDGTTVKQVGRSFGPSERFTADLGDWDRSTLNLPLGESGDPASPWYADQFAAWLRGTTFPFPYTDRAAHAVAVHTLTLQPR